MKHFKNTTARLIDINYQTTNELKENVVEKVRFLPAGESVEMPEKALKSPFAKALIKAGDLKAVAVEDTESKKKDKK